MKTIYLEANQVPANLRGGYQGKKFSVIVTESVTVPSDAGLWSGGSRETYRFVEIATGRAIASPCQSSAPWDSARRDFTTPLPEGVALVCHSMFCGKDHGLTFYLRPENAQKLLPEAVELSETQRLVLEATESLKASYNGKDRYENAKPYGAMSRTERDAKLGKVQGIMESKGDVKLQSGLMVSERIKELENWTAFFPSREEWDAAKAELIASGHLNKAGAITPKGRNAI